MSNNEKRLMTCIVCPLGCELEVEIDENGNVVAVTGNTCPKGKDYAIQEVTAPKRVVMSVVYVKGSIFPTVSVKTNKPVLKSKIFDVMKEISNITLEAPVEIGQIIIKNVAGTDADIVTTRPAPKK
ncbi:MAG: hypothetical protein PWP54_696 [Thermosipho sp. (in: thermotogales)]|nr:hypothetical protein [Thermosipho sp. (in: thermotogales)]